MNIICTYCKVGFEARSIRAMFCSKACRQSDYRNKINGLVAAARLSLKKVVVPVIKVEDSRLKGESSIEYRIRTSG